MGRVLREARVHHDARRPDRRADRGSGAPVLRRALAQGARLSFLRGTGARAAAARIGGTGPQPLTGAADSPPSRAVPLGLQPLQGAGGGAAPRGPGEGRPPWCPALPLPPPRGCIACPLPPPP